MPIIVQNQKSVSKNYGLIFISNLLSDFYMKVEAIRGKRKLMYEAEVSRRVDYQVKLQIEQIRREIETTAKRETDIILEAFDSELQEQRMLVKKTLLEKEELQEIIEQMNTKVVCRDSVALSMGKETDLYQGEIRDILLQVLSSSLKSIPNESRKADVIKDIIIHNDYQNLAEKKSEQLKNVLKSYNGMDKKLRKQLSELGLEIEDNHKHYKIIYCGDSRYVSYLSKTPSDFRSGRNAAATLCKCFF